MISCSYNHFKKTMIYSHLGPFWHFSLYVLGLYLYSLHKKSNFAVSFLLFHNLLFIVTSHVQTSQKLLHDSIGISRSNYFRHKPGLYNKNNSPQLLPASSSDSDTRESAGYHCHSTPSRKKKKRKKLSLGLQLIMAVIRFICQAVRPCVFRPKDSLLS